MAQFNPQQVMNFNDGMVATVLGDDGDYYWLSDPGSGRRPWTAPKNLWGDVKPKTGDIWSTSGGGIYYRVLGVDEVNRTFLIVRKEKYHNGEWPTPPGNGLIQFDARTPEVSHIYVRTYPENYLKFVSRLEKE